MRVVRGFSSLALDLPAPAVTIGNFDGVHVGHQQVMCSAQRDASARAASAVVCTFYPHTARILHPAQAPRYLQTLDQRLRSMEQLGVDAAVVIPFDETVAATSPRQFVDDFLVGELGVGSLHVSAGFAFGRDHAGSTAYLQQRAIECGFSVNRVDPVMVEGAQVSSTRIREAIAAGTVREVARLLGRPYTIVGQVCEGSGRGRKLDTPTANLRVVSECIPAHGVYATLAVVAGRTCPSVTNIGTRPTFGDDGPAVVETHLLDCDDDLYGEMIELGFVDRLRGERRFESPQALAQQIGRDIERARRHLASPPPLALRCAV